MSRAVYIGDEAHAAAWRLAGIDVRTADADLAQTFDAARGDADLVLLSAASAARLPGGTLDQARRSLAPLVLVLPGPGELSDGSGLARRVRGVLGMES